MTLRIHRSRGSSGAGQTSGGKRAAGAKRAAQRPELQQSGGSKHKGDDVKSLMRSSGKTGLFVPPVDCKCALCGLTSHAFGEGFDLIGGSTPKAPVRHTCQRRSSTRQNSLLLLLRRQLVVRRPLPPILPVVWNRCRSSNPQGSRPQLFRLPGCPQNTPRVWQHPNGESEPRPVRLLPNGVAECPHCCPNSGKEAGHQGRHRLHPPKGQKVLTAEEIAAKEAIRLDALEREALRCCCR